MGASIPRLELQQLPADLAAALQPRVDRLGYLGEFFKCAAHQPKALLSFIAFTEDLKEALPDRLTETVALSVAGLMQNHYERNQHERLCRKLGFTDEWIRSVNAVSADPGSPLQREERLVQQLVVAVISRNGKDVATELEQVIAAIGPAQAVAVLLLLGRYVTHSFVVNALQLRPPVPSIFDVRD